MSDLLDEIIAQLERDVNKKSEWLENSLEKTNWKLVNADATRGSNTHTNIDDPIAKVNKVYTALENAANLNKLTDSFRPETYQEIECKTTRSLAQTIARFTRQHSVIQAHC